MKSLKVVRFSSIARNVAFLVLITVVSAQAQIARWTFETSQPGVVTLPAAPGANVSFASLAAEIGVGTATGLHAGAATYSSPAGNGSSRSFSANTWAVGDYYQFQASTVGSVGILVNWDQTSSSTGPRDFNLTYSTDGSTFTQFGSTYSVLLNGAPSGAWSSASWNNLYNYTVDLSSITALDNAPNVYFRLVDASTTSTGGGTVAASGTDRVDNFTIQVVPEPQSLALFGTLGLLAWNFFRRRA